MYNNFYKIQKTKQKILLLNYKKWKNEKKKKQ